jgi:hypothetical protein
MKNTIKLRAIQRIAGIITIVAVIGFTTAACGGGGGGGKAKSNLKSNELIGALPAIHADYEIASEAARAKRDKDRAAAEKSQNVKKYTQAGEVYDKAFDEIYGKYEASLNAEWTKINGKEVPFTMSEEFKKLGMDVASVRLDESKKTLVALVVAGQDLRVTSLTIPDYEYAWYNILAKDGSVIDQGSFFLMTSMAAYRGLSFTKGESLRPEGDKEATGNMRVSNNPEKWVDFASIQLIARSEIR